MRNRACASSTPVYTWTGDFPAVRVSVCLCVHFKHPDAYSENRVRKHFYLLPLLFVFYRPLLQFLVRSQVVVVFGNCKFTFSFSFFFSLILFSAIFLIIIIFSKFLNSRIIVIFSTEISTRFFGDGLSTSRVYFYPLFSLPSSSLDDLTTFNWHTFTFDNHS